MTLIPKTIAVIVLLFPISAVSANLDVCTSCTYTTISSAVSAASSGDTIRVSAGTYNETVGFNAAKNIFLQGGWNSTFTTQNSSANQTTITAVNIGTSNSGELDIEGFTITGSSSNGINMNSPNTDLSVFDCVIHSNAGNGIYIYSGGTVTIGENTIHSNCAISGYGGIVIGDYVATEQAVITDNVIHTHSCAYAAGIMLWNSSTIDLVFNNTIYGNQYGINLTTRTITSEPVIADNIVYSNSENGILLQGGSSYVAGNVVYLNPTGIKQTVARNPYFTNNVATLNSFAGIHFVGGSATNTSVVKNNIIYGNTQYGIYFSNASNGTGTSSFFPSKFQYNLFYENPYAHVIHTGQYPNGFSTEVPSAFGDINSLTGADYNMVFNPHFVDANNHNYHLSPTSFAIDQGDSADSYWLEPSPNGSRINLGAYGYTPDAETSPSALSIANLSAAQNSNNLDLSFNTSSVVELAWISFEYWNGSIYQTLPVTNLTGAGAERGYNGWRIQTGSNRALTIENINTIFDDITIPNAKIRVTLSYGNRNASAESASFLIDFAAPTPTPTPIPTIAHTPVPTIPPTPIASEPDLDTPEPALIQIKPKISEGVRGKVKLQYKLTSSNDESVSVTAKIYKSGKLIDTIISSAVPNTQKVLNLVWRSGKARVGQYKFCLTAAGPDETVSNRSCAEVSVR